MKYPYSHYEWRISFDLSDTPANKVFVKEIDKLTKWLLRMIKLMSKVRVPRNQIKGIKLT
jgi:hypothetical protein